MSRPSAAALAVVTPEVLDAVERPKPPDNLSLGEAEEWSAIVDRLPADWFPRETHGILIQYVRLVERAKRLAETIANIETLPTFDADEYERFVRLELAVSRGLATLGGALRISQQSTYDKSERKPKSARRPWET